MLLFLSFSGCRKDTGSGPSSSDENGDSLSVKTRTVMDLTPSLIGNYPLSLGPYEFSVYKLPGYTTNDLISGDKWWYDAVVYEVFTTAFNDGALPTTRLDYLKNYLGVDAVWTTPVFASPSDHGYDATNYYAVKPELGGNSAFTTYVSYAHQLGLKVILDLVINHCSSQHPWFQDSKSSSSFYRNWFVWTNTNVDLSAWSLPWGGGSWNDVWHYSAGSYYYGGFWAGMPDFNLRNTNVFNFFKNVSYHYLVDKNVDGFRMDAVRYLIEESPGSGQRDTAATLTFLNNYMAYINSIKDTALIVGEAWTSDDQTAPYYDSGNGISQAFYFDFYYQLLNTLQSGNNSSFNSLINSFPAIPRYFLSPFLDNHDELSGNNRLIDSLSGNTAKVKLAGGILLTFPGTPYIYYGTETGQSKGSQTGDTAKRQPMDWTVVEQQQQDTNSVLNFYRKHIFLRGQEQSLRRGHIQTVSVDDSSLLCYLRSGSSGTYLVAANLSDTEEVFFADLSSTALHNGQTYEVYKLSIE
ncbi:MAG TPA: alpha-amylase family glycosyl hydrolase [Spirochaetota bacterium]|nr:alpha-amylase family glycosyl hydrolase [Spirochaetota bacterium]